MSVQSSSLTLRIESASLGVHTSSLLVSADKDKDTAAELPFSFPKFRSLIAQRLAIKEEDLAR